MRGRKPKPKALKLMQGERDSRRINEAEPVAPMGPPPRPDTLDEVAGAKWDDLCNTLTQFGLLTQISHHSLELYCHTYSNYLTSLDACERFGYVVAAGDTLTRNPYAIEMHQARKELMQFQAEWGLTPSSATRLISPGGKQLTDFEKLLA